GFSGGRVQPVHYRTDIIGGWWDLYGGYAGTGHDRNGGPGQVARVSEGKSMSREMFAGILSVLLASACWAAPAPDTQKPLQVYFVDVEGGQATLFVTPEKQSLLIDTGWPGN